MNEFADSNAERSSLREIKNVVIDTSIPRKERIQDYVAQIGNPYRYLDDGIVVEIGYTDTEISLQDRLLALSWAPRALVSLAELVSYSARRTLA